ncbi:MAG: glycosyltransferase, partial [Rhodospirillales bacterium]
MLNSGLTALEDHYRDHGWCRVNLPDARVIFTIREMLERRLRAAVGDDRATLERYHEFVPDERHEKVQWDLANAFWEHDCSLSIGRANHAFFRAFIGPDLHIQRKPYLRIARPGRRDDNIGFHRDTFYGQSPYEATLHIALTPLDERGALQFVSGSHTHSEADYAVVSLGNAAWTKGSPKHQMGFPYAPKKITAPIESDLTPVPLTLGQAVLFAPSMIHGQEVNRMATTRVSVDLRLVSTFAPVKIRQDAGTRGYVPLGESVVTEVAKRYYAANAAEPVAPKLDVVIPTYNRPQLLDRCVRSALALDIPGLRIVVIDDGSTVSEKLDDGTTTDTPGLMQRLAEPRVEYIRLEKNGGLGAVFEKYRSRPTLAKYMTVINDDDAYIDAAPINEALGKLDADPDMALVQISLIRRSDDRQIDEVIGLPYETMSGKEFLRRYIEDEPIKHTTMYGIFRSANIVATGALVSMRLRDWGLEDAFGIDTDFLFRMATMGKAGFVDKPHIMRRETDGLTARYPTSFAYCYYQYILRGLDYLKRKDFIEPRYARMFVAWW